MNEDRLIDAQNDSAEGLDSDHYEARTPAFTPGVPYGRLTIASWEF